MAVVYRQATDGKPYDDIVADIVTVLNAIVWTGVSPAIVAVYSDHRIANMTFPSASVGLASVEEPYIAEYSSATGPRINHTMNLSIRIHLAVSGRYVDPTAFWRLANSIMNELTRNVALGDNRHITSGSNWTFPETFDESDTVGGALSLSVSQPLCHPSA